MDLQKKEVDEAGNAGRIRPAVSSDSASVGRIYAESFAPLFRMAFGLSPEDSTRVMRALLESRVIPLNRTTVLEENEEAAGFVTVRLQGRSPTPPIGRYWLTLRRVLGFRRAVRAFAGSLLMGAAFGLREPPHHIAYVETLAVDERFRRRGFGRALLLHALEAAREEGFRLVGLHVLSKNGAARALYEDEGFRVAAERKLLPRVAGRLLRSPPVLYMERDLSQPPK